MNKNAIPLAADIGGTFTEIETRFMLMDQHGIKWILLSLNTLAVQADF
jgi:hypothetical protein